MLMFMSTRNEGLSVGEVQCLINIIECCLVVFMCKGKSIGGQVNFYVQLGQGALGV